MDYWQDTLRQNLYIYVSPVLIFGGTAGNLMSFAVMQTKSFAGTSYAFLLSCLAFADTGLLLIGLMRYWVEYLSDHQLNFRLISNFCCQCHVFFTTTLSFLAPGLILSLTIGVYFPLSAKTLFNRKKIIMAIIIYAGTIVTLNLHLFFTLSLITTDNNGTQIHFCSSKPEYHHFHLAAWVCIDALLSTFIPFVGILLGNIMIIVKLTRPRKLTGTGTSKKAASITVTLVLVSLCFLILCGPSGALYVVNIYGTSSHIQPKEIAIKDLIWCISVLLFYANSSVNFVLYCISGSKFRKALTEIIPCQKSRQTAYITEPRTQSHMTEWNSHQDSLLTLVHSHFSHPLHVTPYM